MEKYVDIKSPFTGGKVKEATEIEEQEFRKEKFLVHVRYYVCEDTGKTFTTTEQDELMFNELYGQYRVIHGIPFPDDIRSIRERYGLSLAAISKLLGFGINQYANYENGQMPSESNGKMIAAAKNKDFMKRLLASSRQELSESEYTKLENLIDAASDSQTLDEKTELFYSDTQCSIYNGFGGLSPLKVSQMAKFFINKGVNVSPIKINKQMFYSDFLHYGRHGRSISGLRYKAAKYGPIPFHYDTIYDNIDGVEKIVELKDNKESTTLVCHDYDVSALSKDEQETLNIVMDATKDMTTEQLVRKSHEETAWMAHQGKKDFIPYSEAFDLKLIKV